MIHSYYYNSRSELVSATLGNENFAYAFDEIGNRETANEAGTAVAYSANALNHQYSAVGDFVPAYDADGIKLRRERGRFPIMARIVLCVLNARERGIFNAYRAKRHLTFRKCYANYFCNFSHKERQGTKATFRKTVLCGSMPLRS